MDQFRKDRGLYAFIGGYALLVALVALSLGRPDKIVPLVYLNRWLNWAPLLFGILMAWLGLRALRQPMPLAHFLTDVRACASTEKVAGMTLFCAIAVHHGVFTSAKTLLPNLTTFHADPMLAQLDALIHGRDAWRWLTFLDPATDVILRIYALGWFALVVMFPLSACLMKWPSQVRSQFLWTYVLTWVLLGNVLAGIFLSGGPVFFANLGGDGRFLPLVNHVYGDATGPTFPQLLWTAYKQDMAGFGTGISAFPSMHVSLATLFFLTGRRLHTGLGWAMLVFLVFVLMGSVHSGWHYAVDGYASILLTLGLWKAVGWTLNRKAALAPSYEAQPA